MSGQDIDLRFILSVKNEINLDAKESSRYRNWITYLTATKNQAGNLLSGSKRSGLMAGGCTDVSTFLLATNCDKAVCIEKKKLIIKGGNKKEFNEILKIYLGDKIKSNKWGYTSSLILDDNSPWGEIFLWELEAIGAEDINYKANDFGAITEIDFKWAYKGERLKPRKFFFLCADIFKTSEYSKKLKELFPEGIDIYFEKAHGDIFGFIDDKSVKSMLEMYLKPRGLVFASNCKQGFIPWKSYDDILKTYPLPLDMFLSGQNSWKSKEELLTDLLLPDYYCVDGRPPKEFWEGTPDGFSFIEETQDIKALENNLNKNDFGYGLIFHLWQKTLSLPDQDYNPDSLK